MTDRDELLERLSALDPARRDVVATKRAVADRGSLRSKIVTMPLRRPSGWRRLLDRASTPTTRRSVVIVTALVIAAAGIILPVRLLGDRYRVVPASTDRVLLTTVWRADDQQSDVAIVDLATGQVTSLTRTDADETAPSWSPDGTRIAYLRSTRGGEIVIAEADGSNARVIGTAPEPWAVPTWSPDGASITYTATDGIRTVNVTDGTDRRVIAFARLDLWAGGAAVWSPDGTRLAFTAIPDDERFGLSYLYVIDADGTGVQRIHDGVVLEMRSPPAWSPDGRSLVFQDVEFELRMVDLATGTSIQLTDGATDRGTIVGVSVAPAFSPDGTEIAFLRNDDQFGLNLFLMSADGSHVRQITRLTEAELLSLSWKPDPVPGSTG